MKRAIFLWMAACLVAFIACSAGSSPEKHVADNAAADNARVISQTVVASDGTLNYSGSGDFDGFAISAFNPALAGKTVYIEKTESEYLVDGYVSLSSKYAVRLTDGVKETTVLDLYDVRVALPFSQSMLAAEGGAPEAVVVCGLKDSAVLSFATSSAGEGLVQADATMPLIFFAGYRKSTDISRRAGTIKIAGRSYKAANEAGEYLTDPNSVNHPDTARGIDHVQPGERVLLAVNQEAFGETVVSSNWSLSGPTGSLSALAPDGDLQTLVPDMPGFYNVTLSLEGINGRRSEEAVRIVAQNYSAIVSEGGATCLQSCHGGNLASYDEEDKYGRKIFRDIATPWSATAHSDAFTPVAASENSACLKCHTTGFLFADRDRNGADEYVAAAGFDDTITRWSTPAATGSAHLRGVTCEACHGPATGGGPFAESHYSETPISSEMCLSCHEHDGIMGHFFGYSDAHDKAHTLAGGNVAKNAECFRCHTGEGIMSTIFSADITPSNTDSVTGIGCPVCHDPHGEGGNDLLLRITGTYEIQRASGNLAANAGNARICYNCHNAGAELPAVGAIPHNSQVEMLNGVGGYDYGRNLSPVRFSHSMLACTDCHMNHENGTTHDMNMTANAPERIATCRITCHAMAPPEFLNGHYDLNGDLVSLREGIQRLAEEINAKAGLPAGSAIRAVYSAESEELATALNRAAYNYNFILSDRSSGFHNPVYAERLIELSMEDLGRY